MALAIAASNAAMAYAQGAPPPTFYPDADGWTFNPVPSPADENEADPTSLEGWRATEPSCLVLDVFESPIALVCGAESLYKPEDPTPPPKFTLQDGNPPGSIWTDMNTLANVVGVFRASGAWWSPRFTIGNNLALADDVEIATAQLQYDRLMLIDQLLGESNTAARTEVTLFEEGVTPDVMDNPDTPADEEALSKQDDTVVLVTQEDLTSEDTAAWQTQKVDLGQATLQPGKTYHLEFKSFLTTTESSQLILGTVGLGYDNIRLTTTEPIPGPTGTAGGPGVTGPGGPAGPGGGVAGTFINSPAARRLLAISRLVPFVGRGKFRDQVRQRLICRGATVRRCEGSVRIRTANRVRLPGGRHVKRITLGQHAYVLPRGRVGYAKVFTSAIGRRLILARSPLPVEVTVTVLDQDGVQQTLRERKTLRVRRR